jgi:DNA-binding transcriptional regulator YhcF (GntR family)
MLTVVVDRESPEPAYEQIARQIRGAIANGKLVPGQILPPVRRMASDLGFNLNTVARAYRLLEEHGFVRIRGRAGAEVASPPGRPAPATAGRLRDELKDLLSRMRQAGVPSSEIRDWTEHELGAPAPSLRGRNP